MAKKGIGIIGCGNRIREVVKQLIKANPKNKIIGIYDPVKSSTDRIIKDFSYKIEIYYNYKELLKNEDINWVFIGSTNSFHKEQIIESLKNKKNVFSEKPLAISEEECFEIKKEFDKHNLKFVISYPLRYTPHYTKIKEIIDYGRIGKIISFDFNEILNFDHGSFIMTDWRRLEINSGSHLLEKCCHDIDLAIWFTNSLPKKVCSFGGLNFFIEDNSRIYEDIKERDNREITFDDKIISNPFLSDKDIVDNQVAIIEFENGVRASFHTNCSSGIPERRIHICGTKGTIRADLVTGIIEFRETGSDKEIIIESENSNFDDDHNGGDIFLTNNLNNEIIKDGNSKAGMKDAIISAVTTIKIDESRKKNEVIDLENTWKRFGFK